MRDHALVLASAGTDAMTRLAEQQSEGAHVERDKNEPPSHDGRLGVVPVLIDADESKVPRANRSAEAALRVPYGRLVQLNAEAT
jgi:hypothetical protein